MLAPSHDGLHCPYAVRVLANTAVARKVAHVQTIDDRLVAPFVFRGVRGIHLVLCRAYAAKSASTRKGSPSLSKRLTTALASSGRPGEKNPDSMRSKVLLSSGLASSSRCGR